MFNQIVLFLHGKAVLYTFSSVIIVILAFWLIKVIINKITIDLIYKHSITISKFQQLLWLQEKKAYYNITEETLVDEKGSPISLSEYKEDLKLGSFIGNEFPTNAIRVGISSFTPEKQYILNKKLNVIVQPIAGTDIWKVEYTSPDRTTLSHPIMGKLILGNISHKIKDQKEVKIYQRVTYIGKDSLVQYELREN